MYILAIDTSSSALGVALASEQGLLGEAALATGRQHSVALLPLTQSLLAAAGLSLSQLDALAVTIGPGSFTGLRIGLATVKAWVQSLDKPLIAVNTLEALAATAAEAGRLVCPLLDARRDEVYAALFADGQRLSEDLAIAPRELAAELQGRDLPVIFTGDGLKAHQQLFEQALGSNCRIAPEPRQLFMAGAAALLARADYQAGRWADAASLAPHYLRLSEPEEKRRQLLQEEAGL